MKKIISILALATLIFASCSKDDPKGSEPEVPTPEIELPDNYFSWGDNVREIKSAFYYKGYTGFQLAFCAQEVQVDTLLKYWDDAEYEYEVVVLDIPNELREVDFDSEKMPWDGEDWGFYYTFNFPTWFSTFYSYDLGNGTMHFKQDVEAKSLEFDFSASTSTIFLPEIEMIIHLNIKYDGLYVDSEYYFNN